MKQILLGVILLIAGLPAFADFTGNWRGQGAATTADGFQTPCDFAIDIRQTPEDFVIESFSKRCGFFATEWGTIPLKIVGNELRMLGGTFGTIHGNKVQAHNWPGVRLENGKMIRSRVSRQDFRLEVKGGKLHLLERWVNAQDTKTYLKIEVTLEK